MIAGRPPCGGRGLKSFNCAGRAYDGKGRPPCGGRGLKFKLYLHASRAALVVLHAEDVD